MHLTDKVIGLEHPTHRECERQAYRHWQSLRNSTYHKRNGNHKRLQSVWKELRIRECGVINMEECHNTADKHENANHIACYGDCYSKTVKLLVERSLHIIRYLRGRKYLSILSPIAYGKDTTHTMAFHYLCTTHHMIGREGRICIKFVFIDGLMAYRLTCKC